MYWSAKAAPPKDDLDTLRRSPVGGIVRGLRDPIDAGAQALVRGANAIGLAPDSEVTRVDAINREAEQAYQRGRDPDSMDWGRIGGNVAATALPASRFLPVNAPTLGARMLQGARMGAVTGALQPLDTSDPDSSFWTDKAAQAGLGGVFGAAGVPAGEAVARGASTAFQKAGQGWNALQNRAIKVDVDVALKEAGIDLASLPAGVRDSLRQDVAKAFSMGQRPDPATLSRVADARSVGVDLTRGQATRDPRQFQFEVDTRGIANAGEPLQRRFAEQNTRLVDQAGLGASPRTQYQSGEAFTSALRAHDDAVNANVRAAYTVARGKAGAGTEVPPQLLAQRAGEVLETYGPENVPGVVLRRLQSYGFVPGATQTKSFTVQEADNLRKLINANLDPAKKAEAAALNAIKSGIDDAENSLAGQGASIGEEAAQAFTRARHLARNRFQTLEKVDALRAAVEGVEPPDQFVTRHVLRAPVGQVRELKAVLQASGNPQLLEEMKGQVVAHLKNRAVNQADDEFAKFSGSAFRKALSEIGSDKLSLLFTPQERMRLMALARTANAIQVAPAGSAVNTSNTAAAVMNLVGRIPYANAVVKPMQSAVTSARVSAALQPSPIGAPQPMSDFMRRLLQPAGTTLGAGMGGLLGGSFYAPGEY